MFFQNYGETRKRYNFVDQTKPLHINKQLDYEPEISIAW